MQTTLKSDFSGISNLRFPQQWEAPAQRPPQGDLPLYYLERDILHVIRDAIYRNLNLLVGSESVEQFREIRKRVFPEICKLMNAYTLMRMSNEKDAPATTPKDDRVRCDTPLLTEDQRQRVLFNESTLESADRLVKRMLPAEFRQEHMRKTDDHLAEVYAMSVHWASMHLACLDIINMNQPHVYSPELIEECVRGSDHAVTVYTTVREAAELRVGLVSDSPIHEPIQWDEEDEELANAP